MRLLSYNIHKGIGGVDRRYDLGRIAAVIAAVEPDLVLLQEVDEGAPRSGGDRQVDRLAERLGFEHRAYYPNVTLRRGHYGNALLSRLPVEHAENLDLTVLFKKRRGALHARLSIDHPDGPTPLWLFNVHLGLAEIERRIQLRKILAWIAQQQPAPSTSCLIAGDFNDIWGRLGPAVLVPAGFRAAPLSPRTFPAWAPFMYLDRCFARGSVEVARAFVPTTPPVAHASDHLPLVVELSHSEPVRARSHGLRHGPGRSRAIGVPVRPSG